MRRQARKHGTALGPIIDPATGEVMGRAYRWDDGQESHAMKASFPPALLANADQDGEKES